MTNPHAAPDAAFAPGDIHHLVVGNVGRLLDPRRTPVSIAAIRWETGTFIVRIEDFEDKGVLWEIPFEGVSQYQFDRQAVCADPETVAAFRERVRALDYPLVIECDPDARTATLDRLHQEQAAADAWLAAHSQFLAPPGGGSLADPEHRRGDERLWRDVEEYIQGRDLWQVEEPFAKQYVRGPHSGEIVRGHRIVLAESGLVPYEGKAPRDPAIFEDNWSRERRLRHILARLGFVRALFSRLGFDRVVLYRGMSIRGSPRPPQNHSFTSATFSRQVAEGHFDASLPGAEAAMTRVLLSQSVPTSRVFMTFYETSQMNANFLEAEAVVLWDPDNSTF